MISARMNAFSGVDLARLEHDRAAGRERRRDLRGDLVQRVVPRRDRADDADRLAHDQRVADLLLPRDVLEQVRASSANVIVGRPAWITIDRPIGMPSSCAIERGDLLAARREPAGDRAQQLRALGQRRLRPRLERRARRRDRAVDVRRRALRDRGP